jgi:hypothetical protein
MSLFDFEDDALKAFSIIIIAMLLAGILALLIVFFSPDKRSDVSQDKMVEMLKTCERSSYPLTCMNNLTSNFRTK